MKLQKSKLIQLLITLNSKELKWFEHYIHSPFFNKNENVVKLFNALKGFHPEFDEDKLSVDMLFKEIFPEDESVEEQKLRYVMTDLTKLLENYLAYIEYDKNEIYKKNLLLKALQSRDQEKHFMSTLEEAYQIQKKRPFRDVNYYFNQHLIEESSYLHSLSLRPRSISSSLQEAVDNLDYYYLSNRLRYSCAILNREELLQERYNNFFLAPILSFLETYDTEKTPSIAIYHEISMLYRNPEQQQHYEHLLQLLETHKDKFTEEEVKDMYVHALNYCFRKLNAGNAEYLEIVMKLYKYLIKNEIIFEKGYILPNTVKNIVTLALRSGELEWTEWFLNNYKDRILPESRESTFHYNMANIYYFKKEFSNTLKSLQMYDANDIYYHIDGKALLLKTYYELDEQEPFFSLADAFTNYIKRNKLIADQQRKSYLNFIKYTRKIMQARINQRQDSEILRDELQALSGTVNLQWLYEKLNELKLKNE